MSQLSNSTDLPTDSFSEPAVSAAVQDSKPTSGSTETRKKIFGISAAALLLGGAAWAVQSRKPRIGTENHPLPGPETPNNVSPISLPAEIDAAGKVTESMTFEQAFNAAREEVGMGGVFTWHGHWYNTFEKEEWSSLSLVQRQEFTEMVTGEHLPVKIHGQPVLDNPGSPALMEPTLIEGYLNGQRIMGLDFDEDGIIDTLVLDGADGSTYRVVDATGDDGLDTLFRYDSLSGELVEIEKIEEPFMLTNAQFSQGLEASMAKDAVDSILEPQDSANEPVSEENEPDAVDEYDETATPADLPEADDTYVNNGNIRDMDE